MTRRLLPLLLLLAGEVLAAQAATVRPGDTLYRVSVRTGVTVAHLRQWNALQGTTIHAGQTLRLTPPTARPAVRAATTFATPRPAQPRTAQSSPARPRSVQARTYRVMPGDTLSSIARRTGVTVRALQTANRLRGTTLRPGQRLTLPAAAHAPAAPARPRTTEVRVVYRHVRVTLRDTEAALARRYHTTPTTLRALNHLGRTSVQPGMKVLVPQRVPVPIPPAPRGAPVTHKHLRPLNVPVEVLHVDLRHRGVLVTPVLPAGGLGSGARVSTLAARSGARAVINGGYFHVTSYQPAGDLVMQGRLLTWGRIPTALAITPDNRATIAPSTTALLGRPLDATWTGMETVIATGPRILRAGEVQRTFSAAYHDTGVFRRAARSAVGLNGNRDLVFVSTRTPLTAPEMGKVMRRLGLRDALLLDGGSSTGMSVQGHTLLESGRKLSYGIGIYADYRGRRYAR